MRVSCVIDYCWCFTSQKVFQWFVSCAWFLILQALPIYLDKIFHPFVAVLLSVTFVLAFGEVTVYFKLIADASSCNYYSLNRQWLITYHIGSDYSTSHMLKIWAFCWCKLRVACAYSDDHLLSNCFPNWKGNIFELTDEFNFLMRNFYMIRLWIPSQKEGKHMVTYHNLLHNCFRCHKTLNIYCI